MKLRDANLQVNDKNSFTHPPSYILHSFSKNTSRLLFPKSLCRSSRPDVFYEKGVLRIFAKFTGKQLRQSLFFNKVAGLFSINLQGCNFIKKEALAQVYFPVNFANFLRTLFLTEHLWWLFCPSTDKVRFPISRYVISLVGQMPSTTCRGGVHLNGKNLWYMEISLIF